MSPTQRSLKHLRNKGIICEVVERFNVWSKTRKDLFGFIDILCLSQDPPHIFGVQTTSASNISARINKAITSAHFKHWLQAGGRFFVHGWGKRGARGKRKIWTITERELFNNEKTINGLSEKEKKTLDQGGLRAIAHKMVGND